ncbi:hypothetical protein GIB67_025341, partial [Kingdonia uniflora]
EIQTLLAFLVLIVIKIVREESWEAFVGDAIFLAKVWILLKLSFIRFPCCSYFSCGLSFDALLLGRVLRKLKQVNTVAVGSFIKRRKYIKILAVEDIDLKVEFRASSSTCTRASRFFPDLSVTYSNKNISFGIVDFSLFPNAADMFGISLGVGMSHLPTYILYENGVEATRFPEADFEAKGSRRPVTKRFLCQHFELDQHLIKYVHFR